MSEFKGTKGKWFVNPVFRSPEVKTDLSKNPIAIIKQAFTETRGIDGKISSTGQSHIDMMANAKLMASAPELLEALKHTLEILYECECPKHLHETYSNIFLNYNNLIKITTEL